VTALGLYAAAALTVASLFRLPGAGQDFPHGFAGLAVVMALPVCLLRRRPLPVFGLLLAESFAFALAEHGHDDIALLQFLAADVALCFVAATHARRISVGASLTALAVLGAATVTPVLVDHSSFDATSTSTLALTVVIAWTVGNSLRQRREYAEVLRAQAATQAITAERLRIARELHDVIAHSIGIIAIQAGAGCRVIDTQPLEARNALAAIETTSRETLAGLRRLLGALRQPECGPIQRAPAPGLADLDQLAATTADAGIQVDVAWQGHRRPLPADIDLSAYRIIQEAVTNVVRHAGINHCRVSIDYWAHELAIEVVDDGRGGASDGNGYGIAGMRERVGLLDGQFSAGPRPEGGFRVAARLPA
jgi:signal transduction histidine kinase